MFSAIVDWSSFSKILDTVRQKWMGFVNLTFDIPRQLGDIIVKGLGGTTPKQYGGIVPGRFGEPVPIIAHGGERFSGIHGEYGGSPNINFSPTYNITVSDAREFESMIKTNNTEMIAELKRMVI